LGDCELCGAMKVSVRSVKTGKTEVTACARCVDKMNLIPKTVAPGLAKARSMATQPRPSTPRKKNDLMSRGEKELAEDFGKLISTARKKMNLSHQQLGKKMAETVNVIKAAESGKRPTDSLIRKFERILNITLMVEHTSSETRRLDSGPSRGMTFGDYFNDVR
jgi:uncharacterized protein (TIGR00270 family)